MTVQNAEFSRINNTRLKFISIPFFLAISLLLSCTSSPEGHVILCAGDSITELGYTRFLQRIFKSEGIKAKVLNYGKSGYTSIEYLDFMTENEPVMAEEHPDFILIQLGTNDIREDHDSTTADRFYTSMKEIILIFKRFRNRSGEAAKILLALIPPVPEGTSFPFTEVSSQRVTAEINPIVRKISAEENVFLVDNYTLFLDSPHLLPEVHPSNEGYRALAQNWYDALKSLMKP